jgi:hypothetical protein
MTTKTITKSEFIDYLISKGACEEGLEWANSQVEAQDIIEKCDRNDWLIWLVQEVGGPARAEYERDEGSAYAEYERVTGPAWAEYLLVQDPARAEYRRVEGSAWAEYRRVEGEAARAALTWERVVEAVLAG